eukprot:scaffold197803_cov49-Attheya_sp.AAC.1
MSWKVVNSEFGATNDVTLSWDKGISAKGEALPDGTEPICESTHACDIDKSGNIIEGVAGGV